MIDALLHTFVSLVLLLTLIGSSPTLENHDPFAGQWNSPFPRWFRAMIAIALLVNTVIGVGTWLHVAGIV